MKIARVIMTLAVVALAATLSGLGAQAQTAAPQVVDGSAAKAA